MKTTTFKVIALVLCLSVFPCAVKGFIPNLPKLPSEFKFPWPPPAPKAPTKAPTEPPAFSPIRDSKYCNESELAKILSGKGRRKRAAKSFPYDCIYPSIVSYKGRYQFMYDVYTCCKQCDYPTYSKCVRIHGSPYWRCPSDGIHCVLECVKKYGPGTKTYIIKPGPGGGFIPGLETVGSLEGGKEEEVEVEKKLKCEKVETLSNGKTCIRRLCIPLKI